jgi:hypothetical protein
MKGLVNAWQQPAGSSEDFFRLHREPVGDVGRPAVAFEDFVADQAAEFPGLAGKRIDLDAAVTGFASRTLQVAAIAAFSAARRN